jgi:hypothetical protein
VVSQDDHRNLFLKEQNPYSNSQIICELKKEGELPLLLNCSHAIPVLKSTL